MRSLIMHDLIGTPARTVPRRWQVSVSALIAVLLVLSSLAAVSAHAQQPPAPEQSHAQASGEAQHGEAKAGEEHGPTVLQTVAKLFNFAVLVGLLVYYLKTPIAEYLASRGTQIRQELVTASETRAAATNQLAEIQRKLSTLPAELAALKVQGEEDVKAEKIRIADAARAERERLIAQTHREIEMRLRIARRSLVDLAADLAVGAARERITRSITPEDQLRLVDRYTSQLAGNRASGSGGQATGDAR